MTNPAVDLASRDDGVWWGLAALAAALGVLGGSIVALVNGGDGFDLTSANTLEAVGYGLVELSTVPILLVVVSLLVEQSRRFPLIAAGVWAFAQVLDAVGTYRNITNV